MAYFPYVEGRGLGHAELRDQLAPRVELGDQDRVWDRDAIGVEPGGLAVEIEWAKDEAGFQILQARPLHVEPPRSPDEIWLRHPGLRGQPAGVGWATGPACIVLHEHDLELVKVGDVLVTQVAGPALSAVLPRVVGVVAELGGSTSHLAALARERGIPAVLGVADATRKIPSNGPPKPPALGSAPA